MTERIRTVFERAGYGEVYTPAMEYESTFSRGAELRDDSTAWASRPAYRLFDEHGSVLVLRSDMTILIARFGGPPGLALPIRHCASATSPTPTEECDPLWGQSRELLQAVSS